MIAWPHVAPLVRVLPWLLLASACAFAPLDLRDRRCPCGTGWTCTDAGVCVVDGVEAGGPVDAGRDGGAVDGGALDGGSTDGGSFDGGGTDTGAPIDAPGADGGADAGGDVGSDGGGCHDETILLATPDDDGVFYGNAWFGDGEGGGVLRCGAEEMVITPPAPARYVSCYLRFRLPATIPTGAHAISAILQVRSAGTSADWTSRTHGLELELERTDDAVAPTAATAPPHTDGGVPVTSSIRWPVGSAPLVWTPVGTDFRSPDLAPLVTELLTSEGALAEDHHVQVWMHGDFLDANADVRIPLFDSGDAAGRARLLLRWCD